MTSLHVPLMQRRGATASQYDCSYKACKMGGNLFGHSAVGPPSIRFADEFVAPIQQEE